MNIKAKFVCISMAIILVCAVNSQAQAQICEINLNGRLGLSKDGSLQIDMKDAGIINVCSLSVTSQGTPKEACAGWYSALITLKMAKGRAQFYFNQGEPANNGVSQCNQLGNWTTRAPYFLETIQ